MYTKLLCQGAKRYVINIDGQESQPSHKWTDISNPEANDIDNPTDPTYTLDIPLVFLRSENEKVKG